MLGLTMCVSALVRQRKFQGLKNLESFATSFLRLRVDRPALEFLLEGKRTSRRFEASAPLSKLFSFFFVPVCIPGSSIAVATIVEQLFRLELINAETVSKHLARLSKLCASPQPNPGTTHPLCAAIVTA